MADPIQIAIAIVGALLTGVVGVILGRGRRHKSPPPKREPEHREFDDTRSTENKQDALSTDADPRPDDAVDAVVRDILSE